MGGPKEDQSIVSVIVFGNALNIKANVELSDVASFSCWF